MAFHWLQIRIDEERERRTKEAAILARLPGALAELHRQLAECVEAYDAAFGPENTAEIAFDSEKIRITTRERKNGRPEPGGAIEIVTLPSLPGFQVERGTGEPMLIEVGVLPGEKLYYRTADQYLTEEEMTRRILDRTLFPKLGD